MTRRAYDAVIVGARVAGAATGLALAAEGARVLILDRAPEIGDTLSTHALMRPGVELLARWGLLDRLLDAGTPLVRQAQFHYGAERVTVPVRPGPLAEGLIAPRRWLLDRVILDAAVAAGAELALGSDVEGCLRGADGRVAGISLAGPDGRNREIRAGLVIGADGRASRIAAAVGAELLAASPHRAATVYGYFPGIENRGYRLYFGDGVSAGAFPTNDGLHCVFATCPSAAYGRHFAADTRRGMAAILAGFDSGIAESVQAAPAERLRRFPGAPGHLRARAGRGWALAGDAAFFKDPATAHGITDALMDAHALSRAVTRDGRPDAYGPARHAQSVPLFAVTQRIASFGWGFDALKALHETLSACMKSESAAVDAGGPAASRQPEPHRAATANDHADPRQTMEPCDA
ncbi:MAG TPA: FAD-dependent monooxygenase [Amaricoccus sp.]|nr:FAD-dependent monooxygenase [Amaricoccus sp.]